MRGMRVGGFSRAKSPPHPQNPTRILYELRRIANTSREAHAKPHCYRVASNFEIVSKSIFNLENLYV